MASRVAGCLRLLVWLLLLRPQLNADPGDGVMTPSPSGPGTTVGAEKQKVDPLPEGEVPVPVSEGAGVEQELREDGRRGGAEVGGGVGSWGH